MGRMAGSEQVYIVRVRADGRSAIVEDVRRRERKHVADTSELGPLILRWIERPLPHTGPPLPLPTTSRRT
jgi:hypothetical protein